MLQPFIMLHLAYGDDAQIICNVSDIVSVVADTLNNRSHVHFRNITNFTVRESPTEIFELLLEATRP
jgi:nucleoid DNA-binding protein